MRDRSPRGNEFFDLSDGDPAGHCGQGVEVQRALLEDQIACRVTEGSMHERIVGGNPQLHHVGLAAEYARLLRWGGDRDAAVEVISPRQPAVGYRTTDAGRREEGRDARAAGA